MSFLTSENQPHEEHEHSHDGKDDRENSDECGQDDGESVVFLELFLLDGVIQIPVLLADFTYPCL